VVSDSTSVNLFKLAAAALDARPGRDVIVSDLNNFPTDRYVLEGLAQARGLELRLVEFDELAGPTAERIAAVVDERTALVSLSQVDYRSAALADLAAINGVVHEAGALVLWDLCHSAGSVPIELDASGTDPRRRLHLQVPQRRPRRAGLPLRPRRADQDSAAADLGLVRPERPVRHGAGLRPGAGRDAFPSSAPPQVIGLSLVDAGARVLAEAGDGAGIKALRDKGVALTEYAVELHDAWLAPLGFTLASPRDAATRGSHISLRHEDAYRLCRELIEYENVIPDFRAPDRVRLGMAPATTRFTRRLGRLRRAAPDRRIRVLPDD